MLLDYLDKPIELRIYCSELFNDYPGVGIFDLYKASAGYLEQKQIIDLKFPGKTTLSKVKKELAAIIGGLENSKQCQLFRFDALSGPVGRPEIKLAERTTLAKEKLVWPQMQYWLHITPPNWFMDGVTPDEVAEHPDQPSAENIPESPPLIGLDDPAENDLPANGSEERREGLTLASEDANRQESENQATDSNINEDALMPDAPEIMTTNDGGEMEASRDEMNFESNQLAELTSSTTNAPELPAQPWAAIENDWLVPQHVMNAIASTAQETIYFFLKRFNPKEQSLRGVGSYIVKMKDAIAPLARRLLELPEEHRFKLLAEESDARIQELTLEGSFRDQKLSNGVIIVVQDEISDEE